LEVLSRARAARDRKPLRAALLDRLAEEALEAEEDVDRRDSREARASADREYSNVGRMLDGDATEPCLATAGRLSSTADGFGAGTRLGSRIEVDVDVAVEGEVDVEVEGEEPVGMEGREGVEEEERPVLVAKKVVDDGSVM
jgi:hypothetical protein